MQMQYFLHFLTSAFNFLDPEVCKDFHNRLSRHNLHSLLKTAGNLISKFF